MQQTLCERQQQLARRQQRGRRQRGVSTAPQADRRGGCSGAGGRALRVCSALPRHHQQAAGAPWPAHAPRSQDLLSSTSSSSGSSKRWLQQQRPPTGASVVVAAAAAAGGDVEHSDTDQQPQQQQLQQQQPLPDEYAEPPLDDASVRERQRMGAQAGPSRGGTRLVVAAAAADAGGFGEEEDDAGGDEDEFAGDGEGEEGEEPGEDGGDDDDDAPFPEPEPRMMALSDLLGGAAEVEAAALVQQGHGTVVVAGMCDDPTSVLPGDLYVCVERITPNSIFDGADPEAVAAALEAGAAAILAPSSAEFPPGLVPDSVPVVYAQDVDELAARLATVLYDAPGGRGMTLVTVSGTSGKTTVAWLVRGVLEQAGQLTGLTGSIEHALAEHLMASDGDLWTPTDPDPAEGRECSSPFHLVPYQGRYCNEETTPSGLRLQKLLAGMRDRGATAAVVEVDAEAAAAGSLDWVRPSIAVFTNLGDAPAGGSEGGAFDSQQEYAAAVLELFRGLADAGSQRAIVNLDDPAAPAVLAAAGQVAATTYAIDHPDAHVRVEDLELTLWRTTMIIATPVGRLEVITNLVGRHNAYNVLAAVAVGVNLGLPLADIGAGIESVAFVPGRCEVVNNSDLDLLDPEEQQQAEADAQQPRLPADFAVVVDAADTPQRLAEVLTALREAGANRVFTVFGCDGQVTSGETRARMGEVAHQFSEVIILTTTSPGMEDPPDIIRDIVSGWPNELFEPYAAYVYNVFQDQTHAPLWFEPFLHSAQRRWKRHIMEDRFQAIRAAIGTAAPGDAVLLAGRGHRDWVDWADGRGGLMRGWFDDRVEARNALAKLEYLYALVDLDRSQLPWGRAGDEAKSVVEIDT